MSFHLDTGYSTRGPAPRSGHQPCLVALPDPARDTGHGALLALAVGLAERPNPTESAYEALTALNNSYYAAPHDWGLKHALNESFTAADRAVRSGSSSPRAAALTALVLRGRRWAVAHAGHTRVWLMRGQRIKLLTRDHIEPRPLRGREVINACGLGEAVTTDLACDELQENDVFELTSEGVHEALDSATILACLLPDIPAQSMAETLTQKALAAGGRGLVSACVARIEQLPAETEADLDQGVAALPVVPPPQLGDTIDGFRVLDFIHKSSQYRLYKAVDQESGETVALKFPNPRFGDDPAFAERFLHEEWIGKRVTSDHLIPILALKQGRRTALYSVLAHREGENLAHRLARKQTLALDEVVSLGRQLLAALDQLHSQGVIHRDIRPKNLLFDKRPARLYLLGLGSSQAARPLEAERDTGDAGSRINYLAPEVLAGGEPTVPSDIYSAGVTLYRLLSGRYPYGKLASATRSEAGEFTPPSRHRPDTPPWLDEALTRACARDPAARFRSAAEFAEALDAPRATAPAHPGASAPLSTRAEWRPWEILSILAVVAGLLIYLVLTLKR